MTQKEISLVLGTAGHIDHGKTSLIRAITGVDCDRLLEEKKRGITIELGFAPIKLPSERIISVVDVPGHEKFIRQMVAGASGIDAVLMVIAADEGVMPQTREHLDILSLLGVHEGLVVLTKSDMVDGELLELAEEEVRDFLSGTFLSDCPVIPVSSVTGDNLEKVLEELDNLVNRIKPRERKGPFFLPIDRAFAVAGFGTVITGTAYSGVIKQGSEVSLLPQERNARVRSIQVHGSDVQEGWAGQRVAMSLSGVSLDDLERGDVVCEKGVYHGTHCFDVSLRLLSSSPGNVKHWQRVRLHLGTSDVLARISLLDRKTLSPGEDCFAQIITEEELVTRVSERFIVRLYSPLITIGGGEVLSSYGRKARGRSAREIYLERLEKLAGADSSLERMKVLIKSHGRLSLDRLLFMVQAKREDLMNWVSQLAQKEEALLLGSTEKMVLSREQDDSYRDELVHFLGECHEEYPHQRGLTPEKIMENLDLQMDQKSFKSYLAHLVDKQVIKFSEGLVSLYDFIPSDETAIREQMEKVLSFCRGKKYSFPSLTELRDRFALEDKAFTDLVSHLRTEGEISIVGGEYILIRELEEDIIGQLEKIRDNITIGTVRDLTGSSRKYILPLLEFLDSRGYTRRVGDKRILRKHD